MLVHDEVCGMTIRREEAAARHRFQGTTYYFCSKRCKTHFIAHPDWYVEVRPAGDPGAAGDEPAPRRAPGSGS